MNKTQLESFLKKAIYSVEPHTEYQSRCVDGRCFFVGYLPPLAKAGADTGDLFIAFAAFRKLGVSLKHEMVFDLLLQTIDGEGHFHSHTDSHHPTPLGGCGHVTCIKRNPKQYGVTEEDVEFVINKVTELTKHGITCDVLSGEHEEKAVVVVESKTHSVAPRVHGHEKDEEVFVYQKTLDEMRMHEFVQKLITHLPKNISAEKLFTTMKEIASQHLAFTVSSLAPTLPQFIVHINNDGNVQSLQQQ